MLQKLEKTEDGGTSITFGRSNSKLSRQEFEEFQTLMAAYKDATDDGEDGVSLSDGVLSKFKVISKAEPSKPAEKKGKSADPEKKEPEEQ